mmetsp:Transcript_58427/g.123940  ORF Transcript_58427/g.123940 Transcript_58427/m.123940 type:complete len:276 (-) Transcript_58427:478-1305(-)
MGLQDHVSPRLDFGIVQTAQDAWIWDGMQIFCNWRLPKVSIPISPKNLRCAFFVLQGQFLHLGQQPHGRRWILVLGIPLLASVIGPTHSRCRPEVTSSCAFVQVGKLRKDFRCAWAIALPARKVFGKHRNVEQIGLLWVVGTMWIPHQRCSHYSGGGILADGLNMKSVAPVARLRDLERKPEQVHHIIQRIRYGSLFTTAIRIVARVPEIHNVVVFFGCARDIIHIDTERLPCRRVVRQYLVDLRLFRRLAKQTQLRKRSSGMLLRINRNRLLKQ